MSNLAHVLRLGGRIEEAKACDERAYAAVRGAAAPGRATPPHPERGRPDEEPRIEAEGRHSPQSRPQFDGAEARHVEGLISMKDGRLDEAEASFREALCLDPPRTASWLELCGSRRNAAISSFRASRRAPPWRSPPSWRRPTRCWPSSSRGGCPTPNSGPCKAWSVIRRSHTNPALLRFGLAAVLDDRGLFAEAASQLESANALQSSGKASARPGVRSRQGVSVPREDHRGVHARVPLPASRLGRPGPRPVFVVGLPRSGTTLTEQILASHARVHGAGELHEVLRIFQSLPAQIGQPAVDPFEALDRLTPELTGAAARSYLALLDSIAPLTARGSSTSSPTTSTSSA